MIDESYRVHRLPGGAVHDFPDGHSRTAVGLWQKIKVN